MVFNNTTAICHPINYITVIIIVLLFIMFISDTNTSRLTCETVYRVRINYRGISLRHTLSRKCRKIVKFMSITHSERNIWNHPIVATAISREKRKPVLEGNDCLTDRA
jgi:hypothetical protein